MSKSKGNVVNPDEMVEKFGADALRTYIMFMGPFDQAVEWDTNGLVGVKRFLDKVWGLQEKLASVIATPTGSAEAIPRGGSANHGITASSQKVGTPRNDKIDTLLHQTIKKVTEDIESMRFNTAVAKMMALINELGAVDSISSSQYSIIIKLLSPFAPHLCEEIWRQLGNKNTLVFEAWPVYDEALIKESEITLAVQVNGKLRDTITVSADISEEEAKKIVLASEKIQKWLEGKEPKKIIYVKGKLVSIVV